MWAHYAGGHTGFCLEFSTQREPFAKAIQVAYVESAPKIDPVEWALEDDLSKYFQLSAATKLMSWSYEREWRCLHTDAGATYGYKASDLTGVYFGLRMKEGHKIAIAATLVQSRAKLYQMVESPGGYGVTAEPVDFQQPAYEPWRAASTMLLCPTSSRELQPLACRPLASPTVAGRMIRHQAQASRRVFEVLRIAFPASLPSLCRS